MKPTPFTEMAIMFRGQIVKQWSLLQQGTASENAASLTEAAIRFGYVTRSRPVPGAALTEWSRKPEGTPLWAAQTALHVVLDQGWCPSSSEEWCGMAALLFKTYRIRSLNELLDQLPEQIDRQTAAGWLIAAIEEDAHFRSVRRAK